MATYKEIKGVTIQTLDSDPVQNVGSWSSGGALNSGRSEFGGGGIQTSAMAAGGRSAGSPPGLVMNNVEIYDGTSWSETTEINTARRSHGAGGTANTAILIWGGVAQLTPPFSIGTHVESWNGSAWTEVAEVNTAKGPAYGSIGTYTSTIAVSGSPSTATVESWNGSSWTETTDVNNARGNFGIWGTATSALIGAGTQTVHVETWDGSSWTETTELSNNREGGSASGDDSTSGIIFGGNYDPVGYLTKTESWNGSAWTEVNDLAIAKVNAGGGGSSTVGIGSGGVVPLSPNYGSATEEWNFPPPTAAILTEGQIFLSQGTTLKGFGRAAGIPSATWASGADTNTARAYGGGYADHAPQTEAFIYGGSVSGSGPQLAQSERYNGTAWTEVSDLNTARGERGAGSGTYGSAFLAGGQVQGEPAPADEHEQWNGSSWSEATEQNTDRRDYHGNGPSGDSGMIVAGYDGSTSVANTEIWNGSSWTEVADVNTARYAIGTIGSTTASICATGRTTGYVDNNETWNGSSWTEVNNINEARQAYTMSGHTSTLGFVSGGYDGTYISNVELWNGTSWTEINNLATARTGGSGGGGAAAGLIATGNPPSSPNSQTTEEFTADNVLSTVTVS